MAGVCLRPPQFSEVAAWLPPWLQPYGVTSADDQDMPDQSSSQATPKTSTSYPENGDDAQDLHLFTHEDQKNNFCRLFLSGDDSSSLGNTQFPKNALHFDLHLSSEGISQLISDQLHFGHQVRGEPDKFPIRESLPEISVVQNELSRQDETADGNCKENLAPSGYTSGICESDDTHLRNPVTGTPNLQKEVECQFKLNDEACKENFLFKRGTSKTSLLDISKNVKKQKKKKTKGQQVKASDVNEAIELCIAASEAVVISELATAGLHLDLLPPKAILEVALRVKQARNQCQLEALDAASEDPTRQNDEMDLLSDLDASDMENAFEDAGITVTQIIATPDDYYTENAESQGNCSNSQLGPDMKNSLKECFGPQQLNTGIQIVSKEGTSLKDDRGTLQGDQNLRKNISKLFVKESSSITESVSAVGGSMSVQRPELGHEIVASSSKLIEEIDENTRNMDNEMVLSQDLVGSSNFSIDPLCSIVPCSISLDTAHANDSCGQKTLGDSTRNCLVSTDMDFLLQSSHGKTVFSSDEIICPSSSFAQVGESNISKYGSEVCGVTRRQLNSLKAYSMVVPVQNTNLVRTRMLSPNSEKGIDNHLKYTEISQGLMEKDISEDHSHARSRNQTRESQIPDHGEHTVIGACSEDIENQNDERHSSYVTMHHWSRRRIRACSTFINAQECASLNTSSVLKTRKNRTESSFYGFDKEKTVIKSCLAYKSNSSSFILRAQNIPNKRVRFLEAEPVNNRRQSIAVSGLPCPSGHKTRSNTKLIKRKKSSHQRSLCGDALTLHGLEFLLTGFSRKEEVDIENLIRIHGGLVLPSIPRTTQLRGKRKSEFVNQHHQIVLSPKKVQTIKFLYGCAVNMWILNFNWLYDSVEAGSVLPPWKYLILPHQASEMKHLKIGQSMSHLSRENNIFDRLGVMLHGKANFCSKYSNIIKHGGGQVFKTLQWLVQSLKNGESTLGAILVEDENNISRHLKHCALEHNLYTMPASWVISSLFSGKLLPLKKDRLAPLHRIKMPAFPPAREVDMSEEI